MRLTGGPEFEVADGVLVILAGIVNIGAMSLEHETFFKTTTLIFAVGCFTLCIPGVRPASFGAIRGLPRISTMHALFWTIQLLYVLLFATEQHAIHTHWRLHWKVEYIASSWVVLGFIGGSYPGRALHKLVLWAIASASIIGRLIVLRQVWERVRVEQGLDVVKWTEGDEMMTGGIKATVLAPLLSLILGLIARKKLNTFSSAFAERQAFQLAELQSRTAELETARREALMKAQQERSRAQSIGLGASPSNGPVANDIDRPGFRPEVFDQTSLKSEQTTFSTDNELRDIFRRPAYSEKGPSSKDNEPAPMRAQHERSRAQSIGFGASPSNGPATNDGPSSRPVPEAFDQTSFKSESSTDNEVRNIIRRPESSTDNEVRDIVRRPTGVSRPQSVGDDSSVFSCDDSASCQSAEFVSESRKEALHETLKAAGIWPTRRRAAHKLSGEDH